MKTTIVKGRIVCKCGKDLGVLEDSKGYLCEKCGIVYFTSENAVEQYRTIAIRKLNVLDWLK